MEGSLLLRFPRWPSMILETFRVGSSIHSGRHRETAG